MSNSFTTKPNKPKKQVGRIIKRIIIGSTIPQMMFRLYLVLVLLGSVLLYIPIAQADPGYKVTYDSMEHQTKLNFEFWDALFTSCSAITNTGLITCVISSTYSVFGQIIIIILMEIGGIGVLTIVFLIWRMFLGIFRNKKDGLNNLSQTIIMQSEKGSQKIAGTYRSIKISVIFILIVQVVCAIFFSLWICYFPAYQQNTGNTLWEVSYDSVHYVSGYHNYASALWQGLFLSVSAINNAGMDIFQSDLSIAAYRNDWNIIFQVFVMLELILGGIGFPIIFDILEKIKYKRKGLKYQISLFTKITLIGYFVLAGIGLILVFGFEFGDKNEIIHGIYRNYDIAYYQCHNHEFGVNEELNKVWALIFNTFSTRSAGYSTIPQPLLSPGTQVTNIVLMFVGGAPSSTAGGIRVTTLVVIIAAIIAKIGGKNNVNMFNKQIPHKTIIDSFIVFVAGIFLLFSTTILIYSTLKTQTAADQINILQVAYEAVSAFGTVGLSMGVTMNTSIFGELLLILLMFIGQLTISQTILSHTKKNPKGNLIKYPMEDIRIG